MDALKRDVETPNRDSKPRALYAAPRLTVYGPVAAVTAGGVSGKKENKGHPFSKA